MLLIEIGFLIAGIYTLATGKLPSFVLGGPKYKLEGSGARVVGFILMLPLPVSFIAVVGLGLLLGEEVQVYALLIEIVVLVGLVFIAMVVSHLFRRSVGETDKSGQTQDQTGLAEIEEEIAHRVQGSTVYLGLSVLGLTAMVLCPLVMVRATRALKLIDEYGVGERFRRNARIIRALAAVIFLFWVALVICLAVTLAGEM